MHTFNIDYLFIILVDVLIQSFSFYIDSIEDGKEDGMRDGIEDRTEDGKFTTLITRRNCHSLRITFIIMIKAFLL